MGTMNWEGKKERRKVLQASSFSPPPPRLQVAEDHKRTKRAWRARNGQQTYSLRNCAYRKRNGTLRRRYPPFRRPGPPSGPQEGAGHPRLPPGVPGSLSGSPPGARKLPPGSMARRGDRSIRPWQPGRGSRRQSFRGPIRGPPRATAGSLHRFSGPIRPQDSGPKGGRGRARPRTSPLTPQRFRLQLGFGGFIIWLILSLFGDVSFP